MPKIILVLLSEETRLALEDTVQRDPNWRVRQRAQTVLYLGCGLSAEEVAKKMELHVRTVHSTRTAWRSKGFDSLPDLPRSGAPSKLSVQQSDRLVEWARQQPGSARDLLNRHESEGGTPVHLSTIRSALRKAQMVFKRTRHSLKKNETK